VCGSRVFRVLFTHACCLPHWVSVPQGLTGLKDHQIERLRKDMKRSFTDYNDAASETDVVAEAGGGAGAGAGGGARGGGEGEAAKNATAAAAAESGAAAAAVAGGAGSQSLRAGNTRMGATNLFGDDDDDSAWIPKAGPGPGRYCPPRHPTHYNYSLLE